MEKAVARHVAVLEASPLVNGKARALLEDVAFHHLERSFANALAKTVAAHRIDDSPKGDELLRLLIDGEVIAEQGGMIRLVPGDVGDYLAACRVVRRLPRGPIMLLPWHRKFLRPKDMWPWPDSGTALYQAELWWHEAQPRTRRRLNVLLRRKHRDPNVHFVAALLHRGEVIADDLRARTVEILLEHLADEGRPIGKWRATLTALELLEPRQAFEALERLAEPRSHTASALRRFAAVDELTKRDPERGGRGLRTLATTLTGDPHEKMDVAEMIRQRDDELGAVAFRCLADDRHMGDLRTRAAKVTGDLALWADQVGEGRGISDPERLRLLAELADADEVMAVRAAERFAETATLETTPVEIAQFVRKFDQETALRLADEIAWSTRREVAGPVRRSAVHLIGELVPTRRFTDLARLSREVPDEETQFNAATDIVDAGGPITALHDLAANPKKSRDRRLRAARRIAQVDRDSGGRLLVVIAKSYQATDPEQLKILREAHPLAPSPAAKALEDIARDTHRPASFRIRAVEIGVFDKNKTIELYTHIATNTRNEEDARTAARKVLGMDQGKGEELMARLANKFTANPEFQFSLALDAGARAKTVLHQLGLRTPSIELRLKAGAALLDVDKRLGTEVIIKIARTRRGGETRILAACLLPTKQALDELGRIAHDQDRETVLVEAGVKAMEIDDERGRKILRDLAGSRRISPHTRKKIEQILSRDW